jgi:uncharacterized membrane protein
MLVHFPTALFVSAFIFDLLTRLGIVLPLNLASFYLIVLGLVTGFLAVLFGIIDYAKLGDNSAVFNKATWHGGIQLLMLS